MKKSIFTLALLLVGLVASSQIKKPKLGNVNGNTTQINKGVKVPNIKNLSTADLSKLKLPTISITDQQRNAKPLTSWKITPAKLKDTYLEVSDFFGYSSRNIWEVHSVPMIEGTEVTSWNGGFLSLNFRQLQNVEYRIKVKLKDGGYIGRQIYMSIDNFGAKYPINRNDGIVNAVWRASRTTSTSIRIGQLEKRSGQVGQRRPFDVTKIEYIKIDRISE